MFKLEFETDNAAFDGTHHAEVARILRSVADNLYTGPFNSGGDIRDINGNTIGRYDFTLPA